MPFPLDKVGRKVLYDLDEVEAIIRRTAQGGPCIRTVWFGGGSAMTGPPTKPVGTEAAPPRKRANQDGIPVRLYDGALIAHVDQELAHRLLRASAAESFRNGSRRYLRLRKGINIPRPARGWDIIESLRKWYGDKRAADYVAHKDLQAERLKYRPGSPAPVRTPNRGTE